MPNMELFAKNLVVENKRIFNNRIFGEGRGIRKSQFVGPRKEKDQSEFLLRKLQRNEMVSS